MKRFYEIIIDVTLDAIGNITYFIKNNLMNFAIILNLILPYVMYCLGQYVANGTIVIGPEILIPILFAIVIYYLKSSANKIGKGITIPVPDKRFTEVDDDGEVNIEQNRLQELILYIADLEDWLERKGLM